MAAHQAPQSLGFSRQEYWSGLPFPSPMHESEKWKWSLSVVFDSLRPHRLQPTRLLHPWDFPGKSTGVGCHCLLRKLSPAELYFFGVVAGASTRPLWDANGLIRGEEKWSCSVWIEPHCLGMPLILYGLFALKDQSQILCNRALAESKQGPCPQ